MPELIICYTLWPYYNTDLLKGNASSWKELTNRLHRYNAKAITWLPQMSEGLSKWVQENNFQFAGSFDFTNGDDPFHKIELQLEVGSGPINCQLCDHDSDLMEAVEASIKLMEAAEKLSADVHVECHRDTFTETPEKTAALIDEYFRQTNKRLKVNFDYSHPAIVKHLTPNLYKDRLIEHPDYLIESSLIHCRPFNGHHCQIPVTDGQGQLAPECRDYLEFVRDIFTIWINGNKKDRSLWVVPELGPFDHVGYGLSCFPDIGEDAFFLGEELKKIWEECIT